MISSSNVSLYKKYNPILPLMGPSFGAVLTEQTEKVKSLRLKLEASLCNLFLRSFLSSFSKGDTFYNPKVQSISPAIHCHSCNSSAFSAVIHGFSNWGGEEVGNGAMGNEDLILKVKLRLVSWIHFKSLYGSPYLVKRFSYKDIKKATEGFQRVLDNSSRGDSYKAKFRNGWVATVREVKLLDEDDESFYREVRLLARLHHRHIVALCGFSKGSKRFLVFENMERGSLKDHLSDPLRTPLNWRTRLQIAIGIAAALEYLHFFCDPPVYHVSISSSTIMLDENLIPKISGITLSNVAEKHLAETTSSRCSKECKDQECKNIIFQLGLVILELITGQSTEKGGVDLVQWIKQSHSPRSMHKMIDPDLGNNYDQGELDGLLNVARLCINSVNNPRTYTPQILWYLQKKIGITPK